MPDKAYDVVVIGCGSGGAVAGRFAALNGAKTLIVEKKRYIGFPEHDFVSICYSWSDIENLMGFKMDTGCISSRAEEMAYFAPSGRRGKGLRMKDSFWVNRAAFERFLATEAVQAGAKIMVNSSIVDLVKEKGQVKKVVVKSAHETITIDCSVVIGASGAYANIPRMADLTPPKPQGVAMAYEFVGVKSLHPEEPRSYEIYTGAYHGGLWAQGGLVSPHADGRVVVGTAWALGMGKKPGRITKIVNDVKNYLQKIGKYDFDKASPISMRAGIGAGGWSEEVHHKIVADGVMLIGDSAGKPLIGCQYGAPGMTNAMFTGRMAGEAAATQIKAGDVREENFVREYIERVDETSRAERPRIMEARQCGMQLGALSADKLEKAIAEIGEELAALRLYDRGALAVSGCLKPIQDWLRREAK
ncbi:NAD(P)/FAD-dependent oxidoreductase [Chloroflexota bacterium]